MKNYKFIEKDIKMLSNVLSTREDKYKRNFNRFVSNGPRMDSIWEPRIQPLKFGLSYDRAEGQLPTFNVIKSSVNTIVSKLSQTRVRPFFNPVNGTYKTQRVCRNAQVFFDEYFDKEEIYKKAVEAVRDSFIFEYGGVWVDEDELTVKLIKPWEFFFDPAELQNGKLTRCFVKKKNYPLTYTNHILNPRIESNKPFVEQMKQDRNKLVTYVVYYDLFNKKKYHLIDGYVVKEVSIDYDIVPVVMVWYEPPVKGGTSTSMVDNLLDIQRSIDVLSNKIYKSAEVNPGNMIFVPKGSNVNISTLSNESGKIYEYQPLPTGGTPVQFVTPSVIDPTYIRILEQSIQFAYNQEGISELSAQSKKPSGLNSGVALQTMEDVESERHNVILENYIQFMMGIAIRVINMFDDTENILPKALGRSDIKWSDMKDQKENFSIQFSASSSLSKDPKVKMEQIEKLLSMNLIDPSIAASLLDMPDLQDAYSIQTAAYDLCQKIVERAVEADGPDDEEAFEYYEIVDINLLYKVIVNTMMRLDANDEDLKVMENLKILLAKVKNQMDAFNDVVQQQQAAAQAQAQTQAMQAQAAQMQTQAPQGMAPAGMPPAGPQAPPPQGPMGPPV